MEQNRLLKDYKGSCRRPIPLGNSPLRPWLRSFAAPRLNKDAAIAAAFFITSVYANAQLGQFWSQTARISLIPLKAGSLARIQR
jgi:hypothetical protein